MGFGDNACLSPAERAGDKLEAGNLLEEGWFFGNLLNATTKSMSRSYSDPCPSSNLREDELVRKSVEESESHPESRNLRLTRNLARAPSLPPALVMREEEDDQESEFTMGRLIRQASLNQSRMLPPRMISKSSSIPNKRQKDKTEVHIPAVEGSEIRSKPTVCKQEMGKSLGYPVECQEPRRQEEGKLMASMYLSECRQAKSSAPAFPTCVNKRSPEDMKAQIKYWARTVASNVRQECLGN